METFTYIPILLLAVAVPFFGMMLHNALAAARNRVRAAWGELDAALQRRYAFAADLPALAAARDRCAANHGPVSARERDEREFVVALRAAVAAQPALRADLAPVEAAIRQASQTYNAAAHAYRRKCGAFPHAIVASLFGFHPPASFEVEPVLAA